MFLLLTIGTVVSQEVLPSSCYLNVLSELSKSRHLTLSISVVLDRSSSVLGGFNRSRDFVLQASDELNIGPNGHQVSIVWNEAN